MDAELRLRPDTVSRSQHVVVQQHGIKGRILVASKFFAEGDLLMWERPLLAVQPEASVECQVILDMEGREKPVTNCALRPKGSKAFNPPLFAGVYFCQLHFFFKPKRHKLTSQTCEAVGTAATAIQGSSIGLPCRVSASPRRIKAWLYSCIDRRARRARMCEPCWRHWAWMKGWRQ